MTKLRQRPRNNKLLKSNHCNPRTRSSMKHLGNLQKSNTGTNASTGGENLNFNSDNQKPSLKENENICIDNSYNDQLSDDSVTQQPDGDIIILDSQHTANKTQVISTELYWYSTCPHGRMHDRAMIQCSICMKWFHAVCTDVASKAAFWNCNNCRILPETVDTLRQQIIEVHDILSNMVQKYTELFQNITELSLTNSQLKNEVKTLKKQNHQLRVHQYNRMTASDSSSSSDSSSCSKNEGNAVSRTPHCSPIKTGKPIVHHLQHPQHITGHVQVPNPRLQCSAAPW